MIDRRQLWQRLDAGMERTLTLICAPAGYGKSTLLEQWQRRSERPAAHLALGMHSSEPQQIVAGLAAALQPILPDTLSLDKKATLTSPQDLTIDLLNAAVTLCQDTALIIDSHLATPQPLVDLLGPCLDYLPPQLHIFIASRAVPDLRLGRLRIRGQTVEICAADLAFTLDETRHLAAESGCSMPARESAALHERSEGWITALRLALAGEKDSIAAYLEHDVLAPQPDPVRCFLHNTCRLDRLSAALCNAVTGRSDSQEILERLEQENLFIFPLDAERREYRYHRMWKDFLRSE